MTDIPRLRTVVVLFTRDLRVHDNPALDLACRSARYVVPLFVLHEGLGFAVPNRARFLRDCLADLRGSLRQRGGDLVFRCGDPVTEALGVADETDADGLFSPGTSARTHGGAGRGSMRDAGRGGWRFGWWTR